MSAINTLSFVSASKRRSSGGRGRPPPVRGGGVPGVAQRHAALFQPLLEFVGIGEDARLPAAALAIHRQTSLFFPPLDRADGHAQARRDLLPSAKESALGNFLEHCQTRLLMA